MAEECRDRRCDTMKGRARVNMETWAAIIIAVATAIFGYGRLSDKVDAHAVAIDQQWKAIDELGSVKTDIATLKAQVCFLVQAEEARRGQAGTCQ